jgi:hypothetical protein
MDLLLCLLPICSHTVLHNMRRKQPLQCMLFCSGHIQWAAVIARVKQCGNSKLAQDTTGWGPCMLLAAAAALCAQFNCA